jgi:hypothetical protein
VRDFSAASGPKAINLVGEKYVAGAAAGMGSKMKFHKSRRGIFSLSLSLPLHGPSVSSSFVLFLEKARNQWHVLLRHG